MKKAKKVFAIASSVAMIGMTAAMASAADLADFPQPFVNEDGLIDAVIVVGESAATQDVIGSLDIAATLQSEAVTEVPISGSTEVVVVGGEDFDDRYLGDASLTYDTKLDKNDLDGFVDDDFDQDGTTVEYEDYVVIYDGAITFSGADGGSATEYFGQNVMMEVPNEGTIQYIVEIEDDFNFSDLSNDDDVEFEMLGKSVTLTGATASSITIEGSNEYSLQDGDSVTVDGNEITLISADDTSALIEVNGERDDVAEGSEEDFGPIDVKVESSFFRDDGAGIGYATLKIGETISETVSSGDAAEIFIGEVDNDQEAEWVWNITLSTENSGTPSYIGLSYNQQRTEVEDEVDLDDGELPALMLGEAISLPNSYGEIVFEALKQDPATFTKLTLEVDDGWDLAVDDGYEVDNVWGIKFSTDSGSDDFVVGGTKTEEVWAIYNASGVQGQIWIEDGDDEALVSFTNTFTMKLDDESITFQVPTVNAAGNTSYNLSFPGTSELLSLNATYSQDYFGATDEEDAQDLAVNGNSVGTADYEGGYWMGDYGMWFENPEDIFGSGNKFEIYIPDERQYATVVARTTGSVVAGSSASGSVSQSVNAAGLGLGVLDVDAPALGSKPMIIVGGPLANDLAAAVMGNPTRDEVFETFEEGKAIIKYYDDSQALLVAGFSALDTQGATNVVADYMNYEFSGDELEVIVTSLSDIEVNVVN